MPAFRDGRAAGAAGAADAAELGARLQARITELAGINAIGIALAATTDVDELLDRGLAEIVGRLGFSRGVIALVDPSAGVLGGARLAGGPPDLGILVADLRVTLDDPDASLAAIARAEAPLLFRAADRDPHEVNRRLAAALGSSGFVGTPLTTQGRVVGVLVVDDQRDGRPVEAADGPLLYTVGTLFAGAIESSRLLAELEAQNRALESRVAERTRDLVAAKAEADLARSVAEDANEAKSRFLANVSHELRTPLTSVVGFARLNRRRLEETVFPVVPAGDPKVDRAVRQTGETLGIIVSEGERLTGLINDLLDLARIEAGRFEWHMAPVQLEEVVDRALAATAALFETGGPTLETVAEDGLPEVEGDAARLVQVVINLVSNAVKFTPVGGLVRVSVAAEPGGDAVRVEVVDSGRGIPETDLERIFQPFLQASDTLPDGPRGTGLGLPISRQIVEAHGGEIGVVSSAGAGSTFWIRLPARPTAPA